MGLQDIFKILLVDDELDVVNSLAKGLSDRGHHVDAFTDPKIALSKFKPNFYDMSIIDIRMPGINGFELYRQLKKQDSNLKVAFMTSFEIYPNEFGKVLPQYDVTAFITKPVTIAHLESVIRNFAEK